MISGLTPGSLISGHSYRGDSLDNSGHSTPHPRPQPSLLSCLMTHFPSWTFCSFQTNYLSQFLIFGSTSTDTQTRTPCDRVSTYLRREIMYSPQELWFNPAIAPPSSASPTQATEMSLHFRQSGSPWPTDVEFIFRLNTQAKRSLHTHLQTYVPFCWLELICITFSDSNLSPAGIRSALWVWFPNPSYPKLQASHSCLILLLFQT